MNDARRETELDVIGWGEALVDAGSRIGAELGTDAQQRFDQELTTFQRRRCFFYCVAIVALVFPALLSDLWDVIDFDPPPDITDYFDPIWDAALMLIYAIYAVVFARMTGPRQHVMHAFRWLFSCAGCWLMFYVFYMAHYTPVVSEADRGTWVEPFVAGSMAIVGVLALHLVASLFVALSPRDAIIPLIPITAVYCVLMLLLPSSSPKSRLIMLAAWPIAAAPGVIWSTWRHRRFVDRFRWQTLGGRYRDMRADLRDARRVHESLLPAPVNEGAVRMTFSYEPMRDIGGDYLFARRRDDGGLLVVIVDVSGHGVGAALAANRLHGELERLLEDQPSSGTGDVLVALNRFMHRAFAPQAIFASGLAIDVPPRGPITFANAGHPPALVRRADETTTELAATTTLLGVLEPVHFTADQAKVDCGPNDCVVACTDGVIEAADASGKFFGFDRFREIVVAAAVGGADRVPPATVDAVQRFRAGEPADDVLVVALWRVAE